MSRILCNTVDLSFLRYIHGYTIIDLYAQHLMINFQTLLLNDKGANRACKGVWHNDLVSLWSCMVLDKGYILWSAITCINLNTISSHCFNANHWIVSPLHVHDSYISWKDVGQTQISLLRVPEVINNDVPWWSSTTVTPVTILWEQWLVGLHRDLTNMGFSLCIPWSISATTGPCTKASDNDTSAIDQGNSILPFK